MPCDSKPRSAERIAEENAAIDEIARDIREGRRRIVRNLKTGEVSISDWQETTAAGLGLCEGCVLRRIQAGGWAASALREQGITDRPFRVESHRGHDH